MDPDQVTSSEASWSGSKLFSKEGITWFSRTRVLVIVDSVDESIFYAK